MSLPSHPRILVAGVGNIFLGDDGFGCEVVRMISQCKVPTDTKIVDYGIRGLDLAYALLQPYKKVILVDAISRGGTPGSIYVLQPVDSVQPIEPMLDPHSMDPVRVIAMARSLGEITAEIYIVGCEPLDFGDELEGRMGFSDVVARALPEASRTVLDLLKAPILDVAPITGSAISPDFRSQGENP